MDTQLLQQLKAALAPYMHQIQVSGNTVIVGNLFEVTGLNAFRLFCRRNDLTYQHLSPHNYAI